MRLVSNAVGQVGEELEDAARVAGAGPGRVARDVVLPLDPPRPARELAV